MKGPPAERHASALASLLAPDGQRPGAPPSGAAVLGWADARLAALGLGRPDPDDERADEDPRWLVWWLVRMAAHTYRRLAEPPPPVDPDLVARFAALAKGRPGRDEEHAQLHVDDESTLRRALAVRDRLEGAPGPVLAVGDDDAVTVALALLGVPDLFAVDVDPRVLGFLRETSARLGRPVTVARADVFADPVPAALRHRCAAVITDPIRSAEGALPFLLYGAAALRREAPARLLWADHPDWSFDHPAVRRALEGAGLRCIEVLEDLHRYPLHPVMFPRLVESARAVGLDPAWLEALARRACAVSHLYVLERG